VTSTLRRSRKSGAKRGRWAGGILAALILLPMVVLSVSPAATAATTGSAGAAHSTVASGVVPAAAGTGRAKAAVRRVPARDVHRVAGPRKVGTWSGPRKAVHRKVVPGTATPTVTVTPKSLVFPVKGAGPLGLGQTAPAQTVTVKNTSAVPLTMDYGDTCSYNPNPCLGGSYTADYSITTNSCGDNTIPAHSSCTFSLDFTPSTANQEAITVYIFDNAADSPQTVPVTGKGTAPTASISTKSLTYPVKGAGPLGLGQTAPAQTVTVTNTGTVPMVMDWGDTCAYNPNPCLGGSYTSDYSIVTNSCAYNTIPAGSSCTFSVDFKPSTTNQEAITVYVFDSATNTSPQTVALSGQGTAPTASVSPTSLTFPAKGSGPLGLGQTAPAQTVTVTNTGTVPMVMDWGDTCAYNPNPCLGGSYTSDYSIVTNSCGDNTIPAGSSCTFSVDFKPSTNNDEDGTIAIFDSATGSSPQTVALSGQGTAPTASVSTDALSFFSSAVATASAAQTVTVKDTGAVPMVMDWGDSCAYNPNPCVTGSYSGDFSITSNSCGYATIAAGTNCTFSVAFTPSTTNEETGTLYIFDSATDTNPQTISLTGLATTATVSVSATSLTFPAAKGGLVGLGLTSAAQKVTITNTGTVPVNMGFGSPSGDDPAISTTYGTDFAITSNTCASNTIPAGKTCAFSVSFTPSTLNDEVGTLTVYDNAVGGPQTISLTGQGTAAQATLSATSLTFSSPKVGTTSAPQTETVTNSGTVPLEMGYGTKSKTNPVVTGSYSADYTILDNSCATYTIAVGTTCTFEIDFTPSTANQENATIDIYGNTAANPQQIALNGTVTSG
jgi:hypothetical protein